MAFSRAWTALYGLLAVAIPAVAIGEWAHHRDSEEAETRDRQRSTDDDMRRWHEADRRRQQEEYERLAHPEHFCADRDRIEMINYDGETAGICPGEVDSFRYSGWLVRPDAGVR